MMRQAILATMLALASGCGYDIAGTNDVLLEYEVDRSTRSRDPGASVRFYLRNAGLPADTSSIDAQQVRVVADSHVAPRVDDFLIASCVLVHRRANVAVPIADGPRSGVVQAARAASVPPGARVLVMGEDRARAIAVDEPPRVELCTRPTVRREGARLLLDYRYLADRELAAVSAHAGETLIFALGRAVIAEAPLPSARGRSLELDLATDSGGAARFFADELAFPSLPLRRTVRAELPIQWRPLSLALGVPLLLSLPWLFAVRRFDRQRPEPIWLVAATFALGALALVMVVPVERLISAGVGASPAQVVMSHRGVGWLIVQIAYYTLGVGLPEELLKWGAVAVLAGRRRELDEPIDGIVYGAAAALGFAAAENVGYLSIARITPDMVVARALVTAPVHVFLAAIWARPIGVRVVRAKTRVWPWILVAALVHGAYDVFAAISFVNAVVCVVPLAAVFLWSLRGTLAVTPQGHAGPRIAIGTGRPWLCALAFAVVLTASFALVADPWPSLQAIRMSDAIRGIGGVVALAVAVWGLTATLPLRAIFDGHGLTFTGVTRAWTGVRGSELVRRGRWLLVRSDEGDLLVGPAGKKAIAKLEREVAARITNLEERAALAHLDAPSSPARTHAEAGTLGP